MKLKSKYFYYLDYYKTFDGIYNSFWIGKFINKFIIDGKKILIELKLKKVYTYIKLNLKKKFSLFLLEKIEKTRPIFKLKSKLIAGKLKNYPVLLEFDKSYLYSTNSIVKSILLKKDWYLEQKIVNDLVDLNNTKKQHSLSVKYIKDLNDLIDSRFNIRYGRSRIKKR